MPLPARHSNHHPWQRLLFRFSWILATFLAFSTKLSAAAKSPHKLPEVSSTLLKLHKIYTSHPPHDTSLYDTLWISPNATHADIQKSYRKLSRQFHPDKQRHRRQNNSEEALERIRHAYEILNDDATRLPYHKYGLQDLSTAVLLLTGYQNTPKRPPTSEQMELLQLMGYHPPTKRDSPPPPPPPPRPSPRPHQPLRPETPSTTTNTATPKLSYKEQHDRRVQLLAATILERIRPLVEGTVPESSLVHAIWQDCDRLKTVPLGAQIIRCVGRAYRHTGNRYLRRQYHASGNHHRYDKKKLSLVVVAEPVRDKWHDAKHLWTAAIASGRVTLQENWRLKALANRNKKNQRSKPEIAYHDIEEEPKMAWHHDDDYMTMMMDDSDSSSGDEYGQHEGLQLTEAQKAEKVIIELLQVEALWKVHKIGIDRSVRGACDLILSGQYFFFPSHQQRQSPYSYGEVHNSRYDGWVSTSHSARKEHAGAHQQQHVAIDAAEGRLRAAKALVLVGDAMVSCSKDGTAWME